MPTYRIKRAGVIPALNSAWDSPEWMRADTVTLTHFRPEGSSHRPHTSARLLYNREGLAGQFRIEDRYVTCRHTGYMDPVYTDSCVEFFVKPKPDKGYFNFEFNCGGALLASYIVDHTRTDDGFKDFTPLPGEDGALVKVYHTLPAIVEPEIVESITWLLAFFIPFSLVEKYVGPLGNVSGQQWSANFYKCGDNTSHPHWASWALVPELNFHLPECFGEIYFEE